MKKIFLLLCAVMIFGGCATTLPQTSGEKDSGYTYVPIDPFPVETLPGDSCRENNTKYGTLLESLPDNAVRMLIEKFNTSGTVTYGPAKLGVKGESYRVTVDYINADTVNVPVWISKKMRTITGESKRVSLLSTFIPATIKKLDEKLSPVLSMAEGDFTPGTEMYIVTRDKPADPSQFDEFNIPVYIGIGLRVSAMVDVIGGNANISGIGVIGAEAEAERLKGTLVVQTLGVTGKSIAAALPIQSELNRTTAQNAIVAVGSIGPSI